MKSFLNRLKEEILILDGSMGAYLQSRGLPSGYAPDLWNIEKPEEIACIQKQYSQAGADIILTNTFGATRSRLGEFNAADKVKAINAAAVRIAREAAGSGCYVAGDIGPSGLVIEPTGKDSFDAAVDIFHEQVSALVEAGVDILVIETMFDIQELRAAVIAANDLRGSIPLIVHATFNEQSVMDTGTDPETFAVVMESLNADVIGLNCSVGPDKMLQTLEILAESTNLPLSVQPNAGMPEIRNGRTVFPMDAEQMASFAESFYRAGANIIGGCCGTTPQYIQLISGILKGRKPVVRRRDFPARITSRSLTVPLGANYPFVSVGEKINPTGKKKFSSALKEGRTDLVVEEARRQVNSGADVLDVNVGVPLIDESLMLPECIREIQKQVAVPLWLDTSSVAAMEAGLKMYPGKATLNSVNAEAGRLEKIIPLARRYGAAVIGLMTGESIPETAEDRLRNARLILNTCREAGFPESDIIFDAVALTVSAMQAGSIAALEAIKKIKEEFGNPVSLGLSNISFGLPNRALIHHAFLAQAIAAGLDAAILNPYDDELRQIINAASLFTGKDPGCKRYISLQSGKAVKKVTGASQDKSGEKAAPKTVKDKIYLAVLEGQQDKITSLIDAALKEGHAPLELFSQVMTPAIRELGALFSAKKRFIPHLIASAETMQKGVNHLSPHLSAEEKETGKGKIVFATVKGDIHDIGKNICIMMLKNAGFDVLDLGKSVDMETILTSAAKSEAQIIALSALMTTTMPYMKVVIDAVKQRRLPYKVMIGGAAVTKGFAREIGADGYGRDVGEVVNLAESLINKSE